MIANLQRRARLQVNPDTLLRLRMKRLLTQRTLADLADVSRYTISRIENGAHNAGSDPLVIARLARALEVSPEVLCHGGGLVA